MGKGQPDQVRNPSIYSETPITAVEDQSLASLRARVFIEPGSIWRSSSEEQKQELVRAGRDPRHPGADREPGRARRAGHAPEGLRLCRHAGALRARDVAACLGYRRSSSATTYACLATRSSPRSAVSRVCSRRSTRPATASPGEPQITALTPALQDQRERSRTARRSGRPSQVPDAGLKEKPRPADRILITVLYLRRLAAQGLLGQLCGPQPRDPGCTPTPGSTRPPRPPSTARFRTPTEIAAYLDYDATTVEIKPEGY